MSKLHWISRPLERARSSFMSWIFWHSLALFAVLPTAGLAQDADVVKLAGCLSSSCHGDGTGNSITQKFRIFNGAGSEDVVNGAYVRFGMNAKPANLSAAIGALKNLLTPMSQNVGFNSAKLQFELTQNGQLELGSCAVGDLCRIEIGSKSPAKGSVKFGAECGAAVTAATACYTPNAGAVDGDSFSFVAKNAVGSLSTVERTVNLQISGPDAPVAPHITVPHIAANSPGIEIAVTITGGYNNQVTLPQPKSTGLQEPSGQFRGQDNGKGQVSIVSAPGANPVKFRYVPAPGGFGTDSFSYSVKASVAGALPVTGTVTLLVPALPVSSAAAAMTVPVNTTGRLDLLPYLAGSALTGARIVAAPRHGSASMNGYVLTYTPAPDYFGSDELQVSAFGFLGESPPSRVNIVITGRPDPRNNAQVQGLLAAQVGSAWRFADAQVHNIGRRLDVLRRASAAAAAPTQAPSTHAERPALAPGVAPGVVPKNRMAWGANALWQAASEAPADADPLALPGALVQGLPAAVLRVAQTGQWPLSSLVPKQSTPDTDPSADYVVWADGEVGLGRGSAQGAGPRAGFRTEGVTLGVDRRFGAQWVAGAALGWGQERSHWSDHGSALTARATTLAAYAQWRSDERWTVDLQAGRSRLQTQAERWSEGAQTMATLRRAGLVDFAALQLTRGLQAEPLQWAPYTRLQWARVRLHEAAEGGVGPHGLSYLKQAHSRLQAVWGLQVNSRHQSLAGVLTPYLRLEGRYGHQGSSGGGIRYTDQPLDAVYALAEAGSRAHSLNAALGLDYTGNQGLNLGLEFAQVRSTGGLTQQTWRLQLSQALGDGLQRGEAPERPLKSRHISVQISAVDDRNVSRGRDAVDRLPDQGWQFNLTREKTFDGGGRWLPVVYGGLGLESWARNTRLSRASAKLGVEFRYRQSGAFSEPTYALFGQVSADEYVSALRDGWRGEVGASVSQPLTDRLTLQLRGAFNQRDARSLVFSGRDHALQVALDYAPSARSLLYVSAEYRRGDEVSSGRAALDQLEAAKVLVNDDAFAAQPFTSYRLDARTLVAVLGWNYRLTDEHALDFSWMHTQSRGLADAASVLTARGNRYVDTQFRASMLLRY